MNEEKQEKCIETGPFTFCTNWRGRMMLVSAATRVVVL